MRAQPPDKPPVPDARMQGETRKAAADLYKGDFMVAKGNREALAKLARRVLEDAAKAKDDGVVGQRHVGPIKLEGIVHVEHSDKAPTDWKTVRVDLWKLHGKPFSIRSLSLGAVGDGALFDRVLLGRSSTDLDR